VRRTVKYLEMRARALVPGRARTVLRALRSLAATQPSQPLPAELIRDCRFCASRVALLEELPHGGMVAELGTYKGDFAREIVARSRPRELHLIDIDYSQFDPSGLAEPQVRRHRGLAHEVIATFPDSTFDWVYVDADHSYAGALTDARAAAPKIKPGGFIVFNDFAHADPHGGRYGVHRAVVDFAIESGWPFRFFAYEVMALYDVALGKPMR
jgi:SAM-dependent methyltransferase